jgi:cytochrome b561
MPDPQPHPRPRRTDPTQSAPMPRWLTVLAIIAGVALIGLMIGLHLLGVLGPGGH